MNYPKVSIVILNWNGLNDTIECLESVMKVNYPTFETIVVDNASFDSSSEKIKELFPEVTMIKNKENLGFTGGNNIGMRYALRRGADYVWLLNNDTIVTPNVLTVLINEGERLPKIGILSPEIYSYAIPNRVQHKGSVLDWENFSMVDIRNFREAEVVAQKNMSIWGTAMLIKREVIENIGYLNEKFFAYYEDSEYSLRAIQGGYLNKIVSGAKIFHKAHNVTANGIKGYPAHFFFYMTRNEYWFWSSNLNRIQKLRFLTKYLSNVAGRIGKCKEAKYNEAIDACFDGLYSAFKNIDGIWKKGNKIPRFIQKFAIWHPYLIADLLDFNFKHIFLRIILRGNIRVSKLCQK